MTHLVKFHCATAYKQIVASVLDRRLKPESLERPSWLLAEANHLLLAFGRFHSNHAASDSVCSKQLSLLKQLEVETGDAVEHIIPRFARAGLTFLAIKSFLPFPYVDSNLDLVTAIPDQKDKYVKMLRQLGYRRYRNLADLREPMKNIFQAPSIQLKLHLHTAISWNGVIYLPFAQLWQRRRLWETQRGHVWIPSAEDELLIMAAHAWFENKLVSLHEILYFYELVKDDLDWGYIVKTAQNCGWYKGLIQFMSIVSQLADLLDIPVKLPLELPTVPLSASIWLPYIFPVCQNWPVTTRKLFADLHKGLWPRLPRQLFSYLLVDHLWMYRKAYRKLKKVKAICS